jgi:hypothetical protein
MVLIGGIWKSGKTDFALKISEDLKHIPYKVTENDPDKKLIEQVASNIETFGTYPLISDLISLRQWLYDSPKRKLYILDEASEHLSSRRSMSSKNVGFVELIPEISKAHGRLIVIGHQLLRVDSTLRDETYCRGAFIKLTLKKAQLISPILNHTYQFNNILPTNVKFDPYAIAPFTEKPQGSIFFKDSDRQLLWNWVNGKSIKELGVHPMQLNRIVRKYIANSLENEPHLSHTQSGGLKPTPSVTQAQT